MSQGTRLFTWFLNTVEFNIWSRSCDWWILLAGLSGIRNPAIFTICASLQTILGCYKAQLYSLVRSISRTKCTIKLCDVMVLFGGFFLQIKHQNLMTIRLPIDFCFVFETILIQYIFVIIDLNEIQSFCVVSDIV